MYIRHLSNVCGKINLFLIENSKSCFYRNYKFHHLSEINEESLYLIQFQIIKYKYICFHQNDFLWARILNPWMFSFRPLKYSSCIKKIRYVLDSLKICVCFSAYIFYWIIFLNFLFRNFKIPSISRFPFCYI